jgi:FkbM family methyltransferase
MTLLAPQDTREGEAPAEPHPSAHETFGSARASPSRPRAISLAALRRRLWHKPAGSIVRLGDYRLQITDGPNAYMQYKDVFVRGIYRFAAVRPDPLIIDGGSNMGISVLGFRHDHPDSRIIAFEPDPEIFRLLQSNLKRCKTLHSVASVMSGLGARDETMTFAPDGSAGGRIDPAGGQRTVNIVRLSPYLREPVDFLKLNIEGEELAVLQECFEAGVLQNVRQMVVEYHGWARGPQRLGNLLNLLDRVGYRYFVHDFDGETCSVTKPPFKLRPKADWFCLVYAQRPAD